MSRQRAFILGATFMLLALVFTTIACTRDLETEMPVFAFASTSVIVFFVLAAEYCSHFAKETEEFQAV